MKQPIQFYEFDHRYGMHKFIRRMYIFGNVNLSKGDLVVVDGVEYEVVMNKYEFEDNGEIKHTVFVIKKN